MKAKKQTSSPVSTVDVFGNEVITLPVIVPQPMNPKQRLPEFPSALTDLPIVPIPANKNDLPPLRSAYSKPVKNVKPTRYNVHIGDNKYVNPYLIGWEPKPAIPYYDLHYRHVWMRTNVQRIPGPQSFEYSVTTTEGISETTSIAISGQLGVEIKFLSASLSVTFERDITVSREHSITTSYRIDVPAGKFGVWIHWQLVQEFAAVGRDNKLVEWSGNIVSPLGPRLKANLAAPLIVEGFPIYTPQVTFFDN
jgi:hypothetical protein